MVTAPRTPQSPSPALHSPMNSTESVFSATPTVVNDEDSTPMVLKGQNMNDKLDDVFKIHDMLVNDA